MNWMSGFLGGRLLLDLLDFAMKGAAALPLIIALGLAFGRRGNAAFCLFGNCRLARLALFLSLAGPISIMGNYFIQMSAINAHDYWAPFFTRAAMHFSITLMIWTGGIFFLYFALAGLEKKIADFQDGAGDFYALGEIAYILWPMLIAACLFFISFITGHWPFGGYPPGMSQERVISAISRNAARTYFMACAPAGAIACAFAAHLARSTNYFDFSLIWKGARWCAAWAFFGFIPHCLQQWGLVLGAGLRANAFNTKAIAPQITGLALTTLGIACFAFLLFKKKSVPQLAYAGLLFFVCAQLLPRIIINLATG